MHPAEITNVVLCLRFRCLLRWYVTQNTIKFESYSIIFLTILVSISTCGSTSQLNKTYWTNPGYSCIYSITAGQCIFYATKRVIPTFVK